MEFVVSVLYFEKRDYLLSSLISLTILLASIKSSKAFGTFLIATFAFIEWSMAEQTTPYAP